MNDIAVHADHLLDLAEAVCSRDASKAELVKLKSLLLDDPTACRRYLLYCEMQAALRFEVRADRAAQEVCQQIDIKSVPHAPPESNISEIGASVNSYSTFLSTALHGTIGYFSHEIPFSFLIGTVLTSLLVLIAWLVPVSRQTEIVKGTLPTPLVNQRQFIPDSMMEIVGKITGMVDVKWRKEGLGVRNQGAEKVASNAVNVNPQSLVALGDRFALSAGLVEITYNTGAKVILQGPVTYEVDSRDGGFLAVGKLTAKLEKRGEGISNDKSERPIIRDPLFTIKTPTATVTDLGTEFGVEVSKKGSTTSHVFRGSIKVQMVSADGALEGNAQVLYENQSARVERDTNHPTNVNGITVFASSANFVREIPMRESPFGAAVKMFDLVDVVAGGNGFSGKRGASIDPTTGRRSTAVEFGNPEVEALFPKGDNKYHRVEELPFIDGVFVPDGSIGPVQVDSAGHVFADFPKTTNQTALLIRAGGAVPTVRWAIPTMLDGVDYARQGHGLLFLHPNKGITFDLNAIRKANSGWTVKRFLAVAGNTETVSGGGGSAYADFWVLVDGQMQFRRCQITAYGSGFSISIPIKSTDRFLTLASTDGGDGLSTDWIMFGDPRLELIEVSGLQSSQNSSTKGG